MACAAPSADAVWYAKSTAVAIGSAPVLAQPRAQALALQQLHHQERRAVREHAGVEDLDDVRVADRVGGARLVEEPRQQVLVARVVLVQNLDRDAAADAGVLGQVNRAHPALSQQRDGAIIPELFPDHRRAQSYPALALPGASRAPLAPRYAGA